MSLNNPPNENDMRPEYDFTAGACGMHHEQYNAGANVVFLDPDIAKVFKDSESAPRTVSYRFSPFPTVSAYFAWDMDLRRICAIS